MKMLEVKLQIKWWFWGGKVGSNEDSDAPCLKISNLEIL